MPFPTQEKEPSTKSNPKISRKANERSNLVTVPDLVRRKNHVQVVSRFPERLSKHCLNFSFSIKTPSIGPHNYHNEGSRFTLSGSPGILVIH